MRPLLVLLLVAPAFGADRDVPAYRVPEALRAAAPDHPEVVVEAIGEIERMRGAPREAVMVLAGIGRAAVPDVVRALPRASWYPRSLLMASLAESGAPEVHEVLVAGAGDPSWAVREMAAVGLGRTEGADLEPTLLALAGDASWRVRRAAARSLRRQVTRGRCDRSRAVDALLRLAEDPDRDVRLASIEELGRLRAKEARDILLAGYASEDEEVRESCFQALLYLPDAHDDLVGAMEEALSGAEDDVFLEAAEKYAELTGPKLLENPMHVHRLLGLLRTGSPYRVARVFEEIGPDSVPVLLEDLKGYLRRPSSIPASEELGRTVIDLVERLLKEDAAPVLRDILEHWEVSPVARSRAVDLGRRYHAEALADTFRKLYRKEGHYEIRASLLRAIAASDPPDLDAYLRTAILSGEQKLQLRAYRILLERPDIDVDDAVISALEREDDDYEIAGRWLNILVKRKHPDALAQTAALLGRARPKLRLKGADWLRAFKEPDVVIPLLQAALRKEDGRDWERDGEVRSAQAVANHVEIVHTILQSARKVGGERALPLMAEALSSADPVIREKALFELEKVPGPKALEIARRALDRETDPAARRQALRAVFAHDDPIVDEIIDERLTGGDASTRLEALRALCASPTPHLPPALLEALAGGDWDPDARLVAVEVLQTNGGPEQAPLLVGLLREDPDAELRSEAIATLRGLGSGAAVPALLELLPRDEQDFGDLPEEGRRLAMEAVEAIGWLGDAGVTDRLTELLSTEWPLALDDDTLDHHHREAANLLMTALGQIGEGASIERLVALLFTPELHRRFALLEDEPPRGERSLLGTLVTSLVRFPDAALGSAAERVLRRLRDSGEGYRIDEGYLLHTASLLADPRREGLGRPQPRRDIAAVLYRHVLAVAPRESPGDLEAYRWLSNYECRQDRYMRAATIWDRARELDEVLDPLGYSDREKVSLARGDFLRGIGLGEEAGRETYARGLERDPDDPEILMLHAWWLAAKGWRLDDALETALAAGRRAASDPRVIATVGFTLHRMGRHKEAVLRLRDAVKLDEERVENSSREDDLQRDPLLVYLLAAATTRAGFPLQGAETLVQAVAMDDTLADAARSSPDFEPLRSEGLLEEAIDAGLATIQR